MKKDIKRSKSFKAMAKLAQELDIAQVSGPPEDYTETTWQDVVNATVNPGSPAAEPVDEVGKAASKKESMKAVTAKAKLAFALTSGLLDEETMGKEAFEDTVVDFMAMPEEALVATVKRLAEIGIITAEEADPKAKDPNEVRKELKQKSQLDVDDGDDVDAEKGAQNLQASEEEEDDEDEDSLISALLEMEDDEEDTDIKEAGKKKKKEQDEDKKDEDEEEKKDSGKKKKQQDEDDEEDDEEEKDEDEKKEEAKEEEEDKKETGKKKKNHKAKLASVLRKISAEKKASVDETLDSNFWTED